MKIVKIIGCLMFIFSSSLTFGQTPPPVEPVGDCSGSGGDPANFAYVSVIASLDGLDPCESSIDSMLSIFGNFGGLTTYANGKNSSYFKTTLDISQLAPGNNGGHIHFAEISSKSSNNVLPGMNNMIIDVIISYDPRMGYSLIVNYQTLAGIDSLVVDLDPGQGISNVVSGPVFDVTLAWINWGCVHMIPGCDQSTGELEVRVDYPVGTIVKSTSGLQFQYSDGGIRQAIGVYSGDLGRENIAGDLILALPD